MKPLGTSVGKVFMTGLNHESYMANCEGTEGKEGSWDKCGKVAERGAREFHIFEAGPPPWFPGN